MGWSGRSDEASACGAHGGALAPRRHELDGARDARLPARPVFEVAARLGWWKGERWSREWQRAEASGLARERGDAGCGTDLIACLPSASSAPGPKGTVKSVRPLVAAQLLYLAARLRIRRAALRLAALRDLFAHLCVVCLQATDALLPQSLILGVDLFTIPFGHPKRGDRRVGHPKRGARRPV